MGQKIIQQHFSHADFVQFRERLVTQLAALKKLIKQPTFGDEPLQLGAELELYLLDENFKPACASDQVLANLNDPLFQYEINQYNIELNLPAVATQGRPFSAIEAKMLNKLSELSKITEQLDLLPLAIGILPSLSRTDLDIDKMTDQLRYKLLSHQLSCARGKPFHIDIHGEETIELNLTDVTAEGANTSFQVHMMVPPDEFTKVYNAVLLTQPLVTAIAANSPFFLSKRAWHETRVALLKQTLDCRLPEMNAHKLPARVNLGCGWLKNDAWSLYAEAVALYPILLPYLTEDVDSQLPHFAELNFHMGTIWSWNRPVYCPQGNGHIRIELRALPAGPSCIDMLANAAFAIGLAYGLRDQIDDFMAIMPFDFADYNFYRAAQSGIDAYLMWPDLHQFKLSQQAVGQIIRQYLPVAKQGLLALKIEQAEANKYLQIIEQRLESGMTSARWQLETVKFFEQTQNRQQACQQMLKLYAQFSNANLPVEQWERVWQSN
ncbi:hypothetical protein N7931_10700 [Catenovulum sp. 2E275]|uniref:hypothetical protein n=1 Tax=Catenovulum sp. 2E275 TaxID=2980497 RepID=UPI0021CF301F|nr:hypothetical protein [Catenovulum sp. 2E275]MCU4676103.1 hypothetical protein [Catenovulum sp. 2E275]